MTPDEQQELERLCLAVIREKDPAKLTQLVEKLNKFLADKDRKTPVPAVSGQVNTVNSVGLRRKLES